MQDIDINMCQKFHDDLSRNDRALGNGKSDNNNNKNNVRGQWGPASGSKNQYKQQNKLDVEC